MNFKISMMKQHIKSKDKSTT